MTELWSAALGAAGTLIRYGHWGRPVLVFPSERGRAWDFENNGMVDAVRGLIDEGRVKLYCVDSYDAASWSDHDLPLEERARRHGRYESWIVGDVVPWIYRDCGGPAEVITVGCSMGAFHAANFALKRADLFPLAMCFSGNYDPSAWHAWGERGNEAYFNNPMDYVGHLAGDHLEWLRSQVSLLLVCGQGQWEDTTGALDSTRRFAALLAEQGDKARAGRVGPRRAARLAVLARPVRLSPAAILLRRKPALTVPTGTRHLIGLLLGTEDDWPTAFEEILRRLGRCRARTAASTPSTPSGSPSSRSACVTGPGTTWSSTGSRTGTTTRGSG